MGKRKVKAAKRIFARTSVEKPNKPSVKEPLVQVSKKELVQEPKAPTGVDLETLVEGCLDTLKQIDGRKRKFCIDELLDTDAKSSAEIEYLSKNATHWAIYTNLSATTKEDVENVLLVAKEEAKSQAEQASEKTFQHAFVYSEEAIEVYTFKKFLSLASKDVKADALLEKKA